MYIKSLSLFWLFSVPTLTVGSTISSLFVIRQGTDELGGCGSYLPTLETWLSESKALVNSGLQALANAENPSAAEYDVARRYLWSYFRATGDPDAMTWVKDYLLEAKNFLDGTSTRLARTPHLYCNDKWLKKLSRSDAAWDTSRDETIMKVNPEDGSMVPMTIEEVPLYQNYLWEKKNNLLVRNKLVPYWSDDLLEYIFDIGYGSKSYCTTSNKNMGATQQQTNPNTITLCPSTFTNHDGVDGLGSATPKAGLSIMKVLPRSATLYHELFHLVLGNDETPDITSPKDSWTKQQTMLKNPTTIPRDYDETNAQLIRRNPESYMFFCVGY
ncbi:uncharacterized protein CDV56_104539 [Aspergillus thermomutatus]|uniref:Lysine-specific metallo-endopeptidase domain-containing protein n=1 Tax=Aspergillus thermomutatus TaxID=41047 RepID=A0A397G8Y9_ASPTH|nr:uncharacterized protein CDV56_104539 [Aspergillus thermomutatus]RHZ46088.1 hypothetical protein CDV56_104539 [Aspergillus thermomutatus]